MQRAQTLDFVIDMSGLYWATAGTVDAQHHTLRIFILECFLQAGGDIVGTGLASCVDHAVKLDQRRMFTGRRLMAGGTDPIHADGEQYEQIA